MGLETLMRKGVQVDLDVLREFCQRWQVAELAVFGSLLTENFRPDSDIDVLISFQPEARPTLLSMAQMESELSDIFGRPVDLVEKRALERSRNPFRKSSILSRVEVLYAQ
ncbi:MAG: nucleotidyltransferase domain-containing protein [Fimbriimonadales bacterium]|nr:nucleotidyltransferase domain-containing protein [Fimbriimonadales bacterium]